MEEVDSEEALIEKVKAGGGIGIIPTQTGIKIAIALDEKNPEKIFDQINEFEIGLVNAATNKFAGPDQKQLDQATQIIDSIRKIAVQKLKEKGIDVNSMINVPDEFKD